MYASAIGIGSNAIRMIVALYQGVNYTPIKRYREDVRPFAGLTNGAFTGEAIREITDAVVSLHRIATTEFKADVLALTATSACRDATNTNELNERIFNECGVNLRVLSGAEEARLSFIGATRTTGADAIIDIGGGSTEIAARDGSELRTASLQFGAVRLLNSNRSIDDMASEMLDRIGFVRKGLRFAGVGGTITTLAKMCGNPLNESKVRDTLKDIESKTLEQRLRVKGLPKKRVDIILPGGRILLAFMRAFGVENIVATDSSNLDGVILTALGIH